MMLSRNPQYAAGKDQAGRQVAVVSDGDGSPLGWLWGHHNARGRGQDRALEHLTRVEERGQESAPADLLAGKNLVSLVQVRRLEHFTIQAGVISDN